ncbi:MAG: site-2 protease family protein [bacterium]
METGLAIFLGLVAAYVVFVFWLVQTKRLEKWNLSLMLGIVLMIRTQKGKGTIDFIARPKRFWNAIGDAGIVLTLTGMLVITLFFLWSVWFVLQPNSGVPALGPTEIFVIPGVTPFVPLVYGLLGLIVTLVVHEGGHGVLARANGMKLKSIGLLMAIVPIGAFVEPDDLDMKVASRRQRLRVFGAGPGVNFGFAAITLTAFALMMGGLAPTPGGHVALTVEGGPAQTAGIHAADSILDVRHDTDASWTHIPDWPAMVTFLNASQPGQHVDVFLADNTTHQVVLGSVFSSLSADGAEAVTRGTPEGMAYCRERLKPAPADGGECAERLQKMAYIGIHALLPIDTSYLANPLGNGGSNLLYMFSLPLAEVRGSAPVLGVYMPAFHQTPFAAEVFWPMANVLFWIFWINLAVGITNILPMMPLDGGHIFRDAIGGLFQKVKPNMPTERREALVTRTATTMSLLILGAFLLEIFGPHLMNALR